MSTASPMASFVKPGVEGLLNPLMPWLQCPDVSEIMINSPRQCFVENGGEMVCHQVPELTPLYLQRLFQMIASESGQRLDEAHPLLSGNLYNGLRVQLVMPPVSRHHALAIRKESTTHLSLADYQRQGFFNALEPFNLTDGAQNEASEIDSELLHFYEEKKWFEFIHLAVVHRKNIIISGGTSSGKTTFLKACLDAIPLHERLIILEDTRELSMPHPNQLALVASKGNQGKASINMQTLLQATLRLRPDRLIMGEIRGAEIMDFIMACSTGHEGSITSIHANSPRIAMQRMVGMYKQNNVPSMRDEEILSELHSVIDIILQVRKAEDRREAVYCYFKGAIQKPQMLSDVYEL